MARDAELRARITAKDDASKVIDKVADAAADLEKPVEVEVGADAGRALSAFDDLLAEIKQIDAAADSLASALGPELAGKADMRGIVVELNAMGVGLDEVTANADQFAGKLRELSDADVGGKLGASLGTARGKMDELSDASNKGRNSLANMLGNVSQDLGAFGGIAGSAGVGLGQLAEGAADAALGGQKLSSALADTAKMAGPIALLGVAMQVMQGAMEAAAASRAFDAANVKQYTGALKEGTSVVSSFNDEIRETGELQFRAKTGGGMLGMFSTTKDLLPILEQGRLKVADFNAIVEEYVAAGDGSAAMNDRWRASLEAQGYSMNEAIKIVQAANQEADARVASGEKVVRVEELMGGAVETTAEKLEQSAKATEWTTEAQEGLAGIAEKVSELLLAQADALNAQVDAATAAADQQLEVNDALEKYAEVLKDSESSVDDIRDSAIDLAKAQADLNSKFWESQGVVLTSTQRLDAQNDALLSTAQTAKGPAKSAIVDYIASVNQIPPEKVTELQAAVAAGDLQTARRILDEASAPRKAAIQADANTKAAENELNDTARPRHVTMWADVTKGSGWDLFQPKRVTTTATGPGATSVGVNATATVIPVALQLPSQAEIRRQIGRIKVPFAVTAALRADERLSGIRD